MNSLTPSEDFKERERWQTCRVCKISPTALQYTHGTKTRRILTKARGGPCKSKKRVYRLWKHFEGRQCQAVWPAVRRISLVSSESSAGRLWELSLGCKDEERRVNYSGIMFVLCLVQLKATVALMVFNGPKWFNESGHSLADHLGTGLPIWKLASFPICSVEQ